MLHITEDTPADMLSGAMDLTIHLPSGKAVKMCVERRTPMMDLLIQVTTNNQLQITNYTLQPLQAFSSENYSEKVLYYYPNTPIGALDTQYIKVIPKTRILPITKNLPQGTKPFETTFRLKVHLPRNQLYVTRVSKHVHIGDIMRKVCEEKNLDPNKYEVRHPGHLEEILDPKFTLNDYMITEINLVVKGSKINTQTFTSDDMSITKKEERKPIPSKTYGVLNMLFRRGKSIKVTPSSKEYTPPLYKDDQKSKQAPSVLRVVPKVPQRKRRPAPKPPQTMDKIPQPSEKPPQEEHVMLRSGSVIPDDSNSSENDGKTEPGLTIHHSRHSSDSSGYHETSILSDQCNTSLPRKNRLNAGSETMGRKLNRYSESTGNLTKMTSHSRSTSSLIFPGRTKKAAPPPPPKTSQKFSTTNLEFLSPVVASQPPLSNSSSKTDLYLAFQDTQNSTNPPPVPRRRKRQTTIPVISLSSRGDEEKNANIPLENNNILQLPEDSPYYSPYQTKGAPVEVTLDNSRPPSNMSTIDILKSLEYLNKDDLGNEMKPPEIISVLSKQIQEEKSNADPILKKKLFILNLVDNNINDYNTSIAMESAMKETTSIISDFSRIEISPIKTQSQKKLSISSVKHPEGILSEEERMRKWGSLEKFNQSPTHSLIEKTFRYSNEENLKNCLESIEITKNASVSKALNVELMTYFHPVNEKSKLDQFEIIREVASVEEEMKANTEEDSRGSILRDDSITGVHKNEWCCNVVLTDTGVNCTSNPAHKMSVQREEVIIKNNVYPTNIMNEISLDDVERYKNYGNSPDSGNSSEISEKSKTDDEVNIPEILITNGGVMEDWQLPSPPKAFKDNSQSNQITSTNDETDSVITTELIKKLERIKKEQTTRVKMKQKKLISNKSGENGLILSKLSLENLEKRKTLVYNRELAISLRQSYETETLTEDAFLFEPLHLRQNENKIQSNRTSEISPNNTKTEAEILQVKQSTLPNFKITTYKDESEQIKVFEDDTTRSNSDFSGKSLSLNRGSILHENGSGRSMENILIRKSDSDNIFERPEEADNRKFRPNNDLHRRSVNRSESFSVEKNEWSSSKPVARSKSQVALRRADQNILFFGSSNMSRSNSLFDMSGLHSLKVMKKIQNKLNTPTTSMEALSKAELEPRTVKVEGTLKKKFQYTPPSVYMGTWSDRPKVPVCIKEDADYKLSRTNTRHFQSIVKNGETNTSDYSEQEYANNDIYEANRSQNVTVICNGSSYQHNDFNVLTKQENQNKKYSEHNIDTTCRKFERRISSQRPHSVALISDSEISRVPVVRSVELKKKFKDISSNTLIHLNHSSGDFHSNVLSEQHKEFNTVMNIKEAKPVMRAKSFFHPAPVVRGFRILENINSDTNSKKKNYNRFSWQSSISMTLPSTLNKHNFTTNRNVDFSISNLRRTEFKNTKDDEWRVPDENLTSPISFKPLQIPQFSNNHSTEKSIIPKPLSLKPDTVQKKFFNRQFIPALDARYELLKSIRDFGGKKGLRRKADFQNMACSNIEM